MKEPGAAAVERRRAIILAHEAELARAIAVRVVEKPALSVWMILIPLVFLHYMQRRHTFKQGVEAVAAELLRTKREALELACTGATPLANVANDRLASVRAAETAEVALLAQHYGRLLVAEGADYGALVREAYGNSPQAYDLAMQQIAQAELEVLAAAGEKCSGMADMAELVGALERARAEVRLHEARRTFGDESGATGGRKRPARASAI